MTKSKCRRNDKIKMTNIESPAFRDDPCAKTLRHFDFVIRHSFGISISTFDMTLCVN